MLRRTRTSFEISDALLNAVRAIAKERGVAMRDLVEHGLRMVVAEAVKPPFEMRAAHFDGEVGFAPGVTADDLAAAIRDFNEGREIP